MVELYQNHLCFIVEQQHKLLPYINNFFLIIQSIRLLLLVIRGAVAFLDCFLYIPHESAEAETLGLFIDAVQLFEQRVYLLVAYYSEDGRAHGGPCVTAVVGLTGLAATSLYLGEHGESTTVEVVEREEYLLLVCLVVGDKYRFHVFFIKGVQECRSFRFAQEFRQ